jgi:hypothetical protein
MSEDLLYDVNGYNQADDPQEPVPSYFTAKKRKKCRINIPGYRK